jgi:succinate dehydrogenase hydrophobic anchor subunit
MRLHRLLHKQPKRAAIPMKDWAVSFIAAVLLVGLVIWCAYIVIPLFR